MMQHTKPWRKKPLSDSEYVGSVKNVLDCKGMKGGEELGGLHGAPRLARCLDPLLSAPSCDMAVGKDVCCLSLPERETTEIVMCVPSLVPSLPRYSNKILFSSPPQSSGGSGASKLSSHPTERRRRRRRPNWACRLIEQCAREV